MSLPLDTVEAVEANEWVAFGVWGRTADWWRQSVQASSELEVETYGMAGVGRWADDQFNELFVALTERPDMVDQAWEEMRYGSAAMARDIMRVASRLELSPLELSSRLKREEAVFWDLFEQRHKATLRLMEAARCGKLKMTGLAFRVFRLAKLPPFSGR